MEQEYGLTVLKENPDGGHEVEMEFLSAQMGMVMGGKKLARLRFGKKSSADKANPVGRHVRENYRLQNPVFSGRQQTRSSGSKEWMNW